MELHQVGYPQCQAIEHHQVGAVAELLERGDHPERLLDSLKVRRARRPMKLDSRRHFIVEGLPGRDEEFAFIRERKLQRLRTLAAASAAGDQRYRAHRSYQGYTIASRVTKIFARAIPGLTTSRAARNFGVAPGAREAGLNPALPRNCVGGRRPITPPLMREGGPEDEPQARRPAGS